MHHRVSINPVSVKINHQYKFYARWYDCTVLFTRLLLLQHGFSAVLNYEASLSVLGYCFSSQTATVRTRILILKVSKCN